MTTETITMAILTHPYQVVLGMVALFYAVKSAVADHRRHTHPLSRRGSSSTLEEAA